MLVATVFALFVSSVPPLPDLCKLGDAVFKVWDAPTACKACKGVGSGKLIPASGRDCDGVEMQSIAGMAASFYTKVFEIEPTAVYEVSYEVSTIDLVAITGYHTGGVYAQFFDGKVGPGGSGESTYGDGWYPGYGTQEKENTEGWVRRSQSFSPPTTAKFAMLHLTFSAHEMAYVPV